MTDPCAICLKGQWQIEVGKGGGVYIIWSFMKFVSKKRKKKIFHTGHIFYGKIIMTSIHLNESIAASIHAYSKEKVKYSKGRVFLIWDMSDSVCVAQTCQWRQQNQLNQTVGQIDSREVLWLPWNSEAKQIFITLKQNTTNTKKVENKKLE